VNELALFAGAGGGLLGSRLLGWRTVCAVEINPYCQAVLLARQADGCLDPFPIWDDARTFDGCPWRGLVDVVSAGFPCQPFSLAGKRAGTDDERNMWPDTIRIIREVGPRYCLLENVPGLLVHEYFGTILGDLAESGYCVRWDCIPASSVGAPHRRDRLWIVADTEGAREMSAQQPRQLCGTQPSCEIMADAFGLRKLQSQGSKFNIRRRIGDDGQDVADAANNGRYSRRTGNTTEVERRRQSDRSGIEGDVPDTIGPRLEIEQRQRRDDGTKRKTIERDGDARQDWPVEPNVGRVVDGLAFRVDRLKAIGNGQVPRVAVAAWEALNS